MKHIRDLIVILVWTILREYQLLMLPLEFIIDGSECDFPGVGPIKVTIERVTHGSTQQPADDHAYVSREPGPSVRFSRDDIQVGVDALETK